ncbi:MAG: hypothetical protein M1823_006173 [Watsoniomyces obsoletus]|nr:MAG: hypothetical protein M1823_006173 [Watsoniomyces obsoletus]
MDFLISLAHFCEVHGPTSILCTQVLPISCGTCAPPRDAKTTTIRTPIDTSTATPGAALAQTEYFEQPFAPLPRANSEPHSRNPSFSRRSHALPVPARSGLVEAHRHQQQQQLDGSGATELPSPLESPGDPVVAVAAAAAAAACYSGSLGSSEAVARYGMPPGGTSSSSSSSTDTCPNCSLSIPISVSEQLPDGAPGSPTSDGRGKNGSAVLRTREAFACAGADLSDWDEKEGSSRWKREYGHDGVRQDMLDQSSSSTSSVDPHSCASSMHHDNADRPRTATTFGTSFPTTPPSTPPSRSHLLTYLSSRQPSAVDAHALLRRSYIRTLSCEQLPRTHSGPLFFGDDVSGYTISFVFRLTDPCARGRVRRYAFIAWAGRDERRAARAYKDVLQVFSDTANHIVQMVEKKQAEICGGSSISNTTSNSSPPDTTEGSNTKSIREPMTPVSSFLSSKSIDPDGYPRRAEVRAKGLVELTGNESVMIDLHCVFTQMLAQLGRSLGGAPLDTTTTTSSPEKTKNPNQKNNVVREDNDTEEKKGDDHDDRKGRECDDKNKRPSKNHIPSILRMTKAGTTSTSTSITRVTAVISTGTGTSNSSSFTPSNSNSSRNSVHSNDGNNNTQQQDTDNGHSNGGGPVSATSSSTSNLKNESGGMRGTDKRSSSSTTTTTTVTLTSPRRQIAV